IDRGDGRAEGVRFIPSTMLRFGRRYRIDVNRVLGDTNTRPEHALSDFEFTTVDPELLGTASLPVSRAQSRPIRDIRELEGRQVAITHGDTNAASSLRLPTVSVADWGEGVSPSFESYADSEVGVPRTIATLGGNEFVTTFIPFSLTASSRLAVFDASSFPPQFPNPPKKLFLFGGDEALPPIDFFTEIGSNFSFGNLFAPLPLSFELLAPPSAVAVAPNDVMAYDPAEEMIYAAVLGRGIQTISVPYIKLDTQVAGTLVPLFSYRWPEVVELAVADKLVFATDLEEIRIIGGGKQIGGSSESRLPGRIYGYTDMQLIDRLGLGGAKPSRLEATDAFPFDVDGDGVFEESREPRVSVLAVGAQDALGRAQLRTFVVDRLAGIGQEFVRPVSTISLGVDEFVRHISIDTEEGLVAVATQSTVSIVDASDLSASPEMDELVPDPRVLKQWTSTPIAADRDNTGSFLQIESAGPVAFGERGRLYMGDPDAEGESAPTLALYRLPLAEIAIGELSDETVAINEAGLMASDLTVPFELNVEQSLADLSEVTVIFTDAQGTELYRETAAPGAREVVVERRDVAWPLDSQVLVYAELTEGGRTVAQSLDVPVPFDVFARLVRYEPLIGADTLATAAGVISTEEGEFILSTTDFEIPRVGFPVRFTRTYRSRDFNLKEPLGANWDHSFNRYIALRGERDPDSGEFQIDAAIVSLGVGRRLTFVRQNGEFVSPFGYFGELFFDATARQFSLQTPDGVEYRFEPGANDSDVYYRWTSESDRFGNTAFAQYTNEDDLIRTYMDTVEEETVFSYTDGRLDSVTRPDGLT
ncbi:MAG: DUF6531 domain-containing protein, partial [Myxococcota bacterium]